MKNLRQFLRICGMCACGCVYLAGCGSAPPTYYYQLSSIPYLDAKDNARPRENSDVLGIGPVEIPAYVDRTQLVIRAKETELERLEFNHWAEPLSQNLTRILVGNVSQLLSERGITVVRWDDGLSLDHRVRIEFTKFDFTTTGDVSLVARWIISEKDREETSAIQTSRFTSSGIPGDYSSLVSEMSKHVGTLSREIADALSDEF